MISKSNTTHSGSDDDSSSPGLIKKASEDSPVEKQVSWGTTDFEASEYRRSHPLPSSSCSTMTTTMTQKDCTTRRRTHATTAPTTNSKRTTTTTNRPWTWWLCTVGAVSIGSLVLVAFDSSNASSILLLSSTSSPHKNTTTTTTIRSQQHDGSSRSSSIINFNCPIRNENETVTAENYHPVFEQDYASISQSLTHNMTEYMKEFHNSKFDDWGGSYDEIKAGFYTWKKDMYTPYLNDGDSIYESACGVGLNLYMTLEILYEVKGIQNIHVYGNEYVEESTFKANEVYDQIPPYQAQKGMICTSDSSNLSYVPENSFDLVFTGYLSTLLDPLHLERETLHESNKLYKSLCKAKDTTKDTWEKELLRTIAQERQNDWFGKWVSQMTRIAKPGVPVIIESIALPKCISRSDYGGVNPEWWNETAVNNKYEWNVDPLSIIIGHDLNEVERYHVFMLKNK